MLNASILETAIYPIINLLAGLGVFMVGMKLMSESMEKMANKKIRSLLNSITNNKLKGVGVGTATTAIVQSSSATTVMTVGFVNAGVLTLAQAVPIIMGANIGTTITAQLAALQSFDTAIWITLCAGVGAFLMMLSKKDGVRTWGAILAGLGMLFIGLELMSASMSSLKNSSFMQDILPTLTNPILLLMVGALFTAVVQSSSSVTGIVISMVSAGIVIGNGGNSLLFVILGTNIGTTVTAMLSSIGTNTNAKRTAFVHLLFNILGSALFLVLLLLWPTFYDQTFMVWFPGSSTTQIAMFHTFFNVTTTALLLPFSALLMTVSKKVYRDKEEDDHLKSRFIDERLLATPVVAVSQAIKEIGNIIKTSEGALDIAVEAFQTKNISKEKEYDKIREQVEFYCTSTTTFLTRVSSEEVSYGDEFLISELYHAIIDVERVASLSDNILKYSKNIIKNQLSFSKGATEEIEEMYKLVKEQFSTVAFAFETRSTNLLPEIEKRESEIDICKKKLIKSHLNRVNQGTCNVEGSGIFINFVGNLERVGDHLAKIARSV